MTRFRKALVATLIGKARLLVGAVPPGPQAPHMGHRRAILDAFLPPTTAGAKRRAVLDVNLRGDFQSDIIDVFVDREPENPQEYLQTWAEMTAQALMPCGFKMFVRSRWITSLGSLQGPGLLAAAHGLLRPTILSTISKEELGVDPLAWDLALYDSQLAENAPPPDDWAAKNEAARMDSVAFAKSDHLQPLALLVNTMRPQVRLMSSALHLDSSTWDLDESVAAAHGERRHFRMLEALRGTMVKEFFCDSAELLSRDDSWLCLPARLRHEGTKRSALALLLRACGGVFFFLAKPQQQYPYKLWKLLDSTKNFDDTVEELFSDRPCSMDSFTAKFRAHFRTREDLRSKRCRAVLMALGYLVRLSIARPWGGVKWQTVLDSILVNFTKRSPVFGSNTTPFLPEGFMGLPTPLSEVSGWRTCMATPTLSSLAATAGLLVGALGLLCRNLCHSAPPKARMSACQCAQTLDYERLDMVGRIVSLQR